MIVGVKVAIERCARQEAGDGDGPIRVGGDGGECGLKGGLGVSFGEVKSRE
jgi:hypothetical protein